MDVNDEVAELGVQLKELLGLKTQAQVVKVTNQVVETARKRDVPTSVIVDELRTVSVRRGRARFPDINQGVIDRWTGVHFASGAMLGLIGITPSGAVAIGAAVELVEKVAKERRPELFPHPSPDSALNTAGDLVAIGLGAWFTNGR